MVKASALPHQLGTWGGAIKTALVRDDVLGRARQPATRFIIDAGTHIERGDAHTAQRRARRFLTVPDLPDQRRADRLLKKELRRLTQTGDPFEASGHVKSAVLRLHPDDPVKRDVVRRLMQFEGGVYSDARVMSFVTLSDIVKAEGAGIVPLLCELAGDKTDPNVRLSAIFFLSNIVTGTGSLRKFVPLDDETQGRIVEAFADALQLRNPMVQQRHALRGLMSWVERYSCSNTQLYHLAMEYIAQATGDDGLNEMISDRIKQSPHIFALNAVSGFGIALNFGYGWIHEEARRRLIGHLRDIQSLPVAAVTIGGILAKIVCRESENSVVRLEAATALSNQKYLETGAITILTEFLQGKNKDIEVLRLVVAVLDKTLTRIDPESKLRFGIYHALFCCLWNIGEQDAIKDQIVQVIISDLHGKNVGEVVNSMIEGADINSALI